MFHNSHFVAPTRCEVLPQNILIFSLSRKRSGIAGSFSVISLFFLIHQLPHRFDVLPFQLAEHCRIKSRCFDRAAVPGFGIKVSLYSLHNKFPVMTGLDLIDRHLQFIIRHSLQLLCIYLTAGAVRKYVFLRICIGIQICLP